MSKSNENMRPIKIRSEYYRRIEDIVSQSYQFNSVSEYVNFVLKEFLETNDEITTEEKSELEKRLKDLGYL